MAVSPADIIVRPANDDDIPAMVDLEQQRFGKTGTDVYDEKYMTCWLDVNPAGLTVAEHGGAVVAYHYCQRIQLRLQDHARLVNYNAATDDGYTRRTHVPNGNCTMCVTVCSVLPGAARTLYAALFKELSVGDSEYYLAFSRISGFDQYCRALEAAGAYPSDVEPLTLATWYAQSCVDLVGGNMWAMFPKVHLDGVPKPTVRDPVLTSHVRHPGYGAAGMRAKWMKDPQSREFAVMVLYQNPHVA